MKSIQKTLVVSLIVAVVAVEAGQLKADLLSYSASAYRDPGNTLWAGSSTFDSGGQLAGTVEWAIFRPDTFESIFGGSSGYTPASNELVYTYQVKNTGSLDISTLDVYLNSSVPYDNAGAFSIPSSAGMAPAYSSIFAGLAEWYFSDPHTGAGILPGQSSEGLAYSSPNVPEMDSGQVYNGGGRVSLSLPGPSANLAVIPEPSTAVLLAIMGIFAGLGVRFRRR